MKPRRSASGVATITVITKPWPCSGSCRFCPNDLACPKSYLANEPACERAVQSLFDPYLQVSARLTALSQMGHATDKIELIVLGGTWSDYPEAYQTWFVRELFRALNDDAVAGTAANPLLRGFAEDGEAPSAATDPERPGGARRQPVRPTRSLQGFVPGARSTVRAGCSTRGSTRGDARRAAGSAAAGIDPELFAQAQAAVNAGELTYNQAVTRLYGGSEAWQRAAEMQGATLDELEREQRRNESARHRVVGLVVETRPDAITPERLLHIRRLGATKIQMGVQSTCQRILNANNRNTTVGQIERAFSLLRLFGFKIHAHAMVNLLGTTPETDRADYERLVRDPAFLPDEVKLYPCALIEGAALCRDYATGAWRPYAEDELIDVLCADVRATPAWTRVSRMIRDFSTGDIVAGNKKPNLRQLVRGAPARRGAGGHPAGGRDPLSRDRDARG